MFVVQQDKNSRYAKFYTGLSIYKDTTEAIMLQDFSKIFRKIPRNPNCFFVFEDIPYNYT